MRSSRLLPIFVLGATAATLAGVGSASASPAKTKTTVLRYYGVVTHMGFSSATGGPVPSNAAPVAGDRSFATLDLYAGDRAHHAKSFSATALLYCTIESVSKTDVPAACDGVFATGDSMLVSVSTQNFASNSATQVYPCSGGTGNYAHATGELVSTDIPNSPNSNIVLTVVTL